MVCGRLELPSSGPAGTGIHRTPKHQIRRAEAAGLPNVHLTGFLPLLFAVTGVSMWLMKRRARQRMAIRGAAMAEAAE